jgi:hypothetical protein
VEVELPPRDEMLVCPNEGCHKPFKVDVPTAEPIAPLLLPEEEKAPLPSPAAAEAAPPQAQPITQQPEEHLATVRLDMFRRYPFRVAGYLVLTVVGVYGAVVSFLGDYHFLGAAFLLASAIVFSNLLRWWLRAINTRLTITTQRCILERGTFRKDVVEEALADINDVRVYQTFPQRLLDVGDLAVHNKNAGAPRVIVLGIRAPERVAALIRDGRVKVPEAASK